MLCFRLILSLALLATWFGSGNAANKLEILRQRIRNDERRLSKDFNALQAMMLSGTIKNAPVRNWGPRATQRPYYRPHPVLPTNAPVRNWGPRATQRPYYRPQIAMPTNAPVRNWGPRATQRPYYRPQIAMPTNAPGPSQRKPNYNWQSRNNPTKITNTNGQTDRNVNRVKAGRPNVASTPSSKIFIQKTYNVHGRYQVTQTVRNSTSTNSSIFVHYVCNSRGVCVRHYTVGFYSTVSVGGVVLLMLIICAAVIVRRRRLVVQQYSVLSDTDAQHMMGGTMRVGPLPGQGLSVQSDPVIVGQV
ncbi:hypothetical protein BOX15_Mlig029483g1 [Macrostomum lignano]|uniref:Uncharacterized protein n=1 Tax=Macrostomum lignano TaxID=282301 RepID=A0A267E4B4_9PLAT|nr:hypothetical protein BOX15_Mlig029483g1 [Macrostomum lignano]